jgi:hypothetical protein
VDAAVADVLKGLQDRSTADGEAHLQTAGQATSLHDLKADRRRLIECVVRAFRHRPELAQFRQGTYQGSTISAFCTDLNRKLAFAKEHEAELAPVGAGKDFQTKLETKLRALEADSGAQEAAIACLPSAQTQFSTVRPRMSPASRAASSVTRMAPSSTAVAAIRRSMSAFIRPRARNCALTVPHRSPS